MKYLIFHRKDEIEKVSEMFEKTNIIRSITFFNDSEKVRIQVRDEDQFWWVFNSHF